MASSRSKNGDVRHEEEDKVYEQSNAEFRGTMLD